jgi:hypothetical protein
MKNCVLLDEPPDADPHVRWCERGRLVTAPYSISPSLSLRVIIFFILYPQAYNIL